MKGLLLKDIYTLTKQMKIFLIIIIVWSCLPGFSASSFAIIYAAMLPLTALAYDERSKWNSLAAMMPYTERSIVFSKYVLGYISVVCAAFLSILAQFVISLFKKVSFEPESYISIIIAICIALIIQSINLPVMFKLGVEKGRYVFFALVAVIVVGGMAVGDKIIAILKDITISPYLLIFDAIFATVIINIISVLIATKIYKNKVK